MKEPPGRYGFRGYRKFEYLPLVEQRIRREFGAGMQEGVKIEAKLIVGFERGCYESWCQNWEVKLYPDLSNYTDPVKVEIRTGDDCLEDALVKAMDLLRRYKALPRERILRKVQDRPPKHLWAFDFEQMEKEDEASMYK